MTTCPICKQTFGSQIELNIHLSHKHSGYASTKPTSTNSAKETSQAVPLEIPKADEEEPNYKDSQKIIGQLYPVLKSKDGQVIDGFHRLAVDPNWKSVVLPEVDTEEKLLIARAVSNWQRREVSHEEKAGWINGLAEIYQKQDVAIGSAIIQRIMEVTGLARKTTTNYLDAKYKEIENAAVTHPPRISASKRVENMLGPVVKERFREEVKQELAEEATLSPEEKIKLEAEKQRKKEEQEQIAQVKKLEKEKKTQEKKLQAEEKRKECEVVKQRKKEEQKLKEEKERKQLEEKIRKEVVKQNLAEVKQELLKDPSFQREVLQEVDKPQIEESTEASAEIEIENNSTNTKTQQIVKEMIEEYLPAIKEAYKKIKPEKNHEPERNKLVLNMLLKNLEQGLIFCPICDQQMFECSHCHTSLSKMKEDTRI